MNARFTGALASIIVIIGANKACGQDIAQQVRQTRDGEVQLLFASKPGTCGDGRTFISTGGVDEEGNQTTFMQTGRGFNTTRGSGNYHYRKCDEGPVRVVLSVANGNVTEVETFVGRVPDGVASRVSARAAVDYLLGLAERGSERVGKHAILPALLADSVEPWPRLLQIAKNTSVDKDVRRMAIFWLGQAAGDKATQGLRSLLSDEDAEVKKAAVFALSQLRGEESVSALIDVVKTSKDKEVRKSALFWLSQKNDPRVLALFEDILLKN
jgi:hypothetical protein